MLCDKNSISKIYKASARVGYVPPVWSRTQVQGLTNNQRGRCSGPCLLWGGFDKGIISWIHFKFNLRNHDFFQNATLAYMFIHVYDCELNKMPNIYICFRFKTQAGTYIWRRGHEYTACSYITIPPEQVSLMHFIILFLSIAKYRKMQSEVQAWED